MENKVGERIRYHRLQRGMSQEKLALLAGINPAFLGHLERGLKSPTFTTLDKIVEALELNYSEFLMILSVRKIPQADNSIWI